MGSAGASSLAAAFRGWASRDDPPHMLCTHLPHDLPGAALGVLGQDQLGFLVAGLVEGVVAAVLLVPGKRHLPELRRTAALDRGQRVRVRAEARRIVGSGRSNATRGARSLGRPIWIRL